MGKKLKFLYEKILGMDSFFFAGETIKDIVVCILVIQFLIGKIDYFIKYVGEQYIILWCFAIMLVPIYYCGKYLGIDFGEDN